MAVVRVATCQFPVSADIRRNLDFIVRQTREAKERGADIVHFPDGALSGYAGVDFATFDGFDWNGLRTGRVLDLARQMGIWVVLGSAHELSGAHKPHNSLYVINDAGEIVDRYDKRFCAGATDEQTGDLAHYSPGDHFRVWEINGVRCGALICYDYRYPELYREYAKSGVGLMFHSFHAANVSPERVEVIGAGMGPAFKHLNPAATFTYPGVTMPAAMTTAAACNHMSISCPNSCARESLWPAFFVRADGVTLGRLRRNTTGVLVSTVDTAEDLYDSTGAWRNRTIAGVLHSGTAVDDPRSKNRTAF